MPTYSYNARDGTGAAIHGTLIAASIAEATRTLRGEGKYPTSVVPVEQGGAVQAARQIAGRGIKVPRADVIQISTQLAIMLETGVTLSEALDCIGVQLTEKPKVKKLVEDLSEIVKAGNDFSTALARHPRSFPRLYVALVKASERTGMLSKLITRATNYLRDEQETLRRVRGALTYPSIMLGFAVTTTIFLLAFVLPRFATIYAGKKAALPVPTKILMAMSGFIVGHWLVLILSILTAGIVAYFYFRTKGGQRVLHYMQLRAPLLGGMFRKLHLARGLRMIGTMAGAGVNLVDCVTTAQDLCANSYFREMWSSVLDQIQAGHQFSQPLFNSPLVPRSVAQMLHSGEKSGKLSQVMEQVSAFSELELKEKIADMTRYIEPAMIIVMGAIIGGVAMALLLPVFTISRVVAH
jgi:type IV pilus assembly protein PilC